MYTAVEKGSKYSESYAVYIKQNEKIISPFHDISPNIKENSNIITVFNEIPRFENAKFEMSKKSPYNPIVQDVKKNEPRFVPNIFPFKGYIWNYGAIPQTWENPNTKDEYTQVCGDNDPIDIIDISDQIKPTGLVYEAKVLGCLAMIDGNECDWKVLVIDTSDPNSSKLETIDDVKKNYPFLIENTIKWFKDYKKPDGKGENKFALDSQFMDSKFAMKIIKEAHQEWKKMFFSNDKNVDINRINSTFTESKCFCDTFSISEEKSEDSEVPKKIDKFYYF